MSKYSNSTRYWPFLVLLTMVQSMGWAQTDPFSTLVETLKPNVVAIRARVDGNEEYGFGFITAEQNDSLCIATAAHVVLGREVANTLPQIQIKFYSDINWYPATLKRKWEKDDLAFLKVGKPSGIKWQPNCMAPILGVNQKVRFIGFNWEDLGLDGNIFRVEEPKLRISIPTIIPGTSGAPLINERGIVGMILEDEGVISEALNITRIKKLFSEEGRYPYFELQENDPYHMVLVKGGTFTMGCTSEQGSDCYDAEKLSHVTLSTFSISKYEVTQAQWRKVMGSDPPGLAFPGCDECPAERVSWNDVQEFLRILNAQTGKNYRLPTEAEWEFAARGGNLSKGYKYAGSNDLSEVAWYYDNSISKTHPVGQKKANELGLYDMSGNVYEWCQDWFGAYSSNTQTNSTGAASGANRVYRVGSWGSKAKDCRVSSRGASSPANRSYDLGFRLAL